MYILIYSKCTSSDMGQSEVLNTLIVDCSFFACSTNYDDSKYYGVIQVWLNHGQFVANRICAQNITKGREGYFANINVQKEPTTHIAQFNQTTTINCYSAADYSDAISITYGI